MKYKCDMVKDLMPLYLDKEASESSEKAVVEHLAGCKECAGYYEELKKEIGPVNGECKDEKYISLAAKLRKRKRIIKAVIGILILLCILSVPFLNYACGYHMTSRAAAKINYVIDYQMSPEATNRFNAEKLEKEYGYEHKIIGCYEWKEDIHFYFIDSTRDYNIVKVYKTWHGWKREDHFVNWAKRSFYDDTVGVELAGQKWHNEEFDQSEAYPGEAIKLFPVMVHDESVKSLEVTCFGETQTKEVTPGELTLFVYDIPEDAMYDEAQGTAYDAEGNVIYRMDCSDARKLWKPVEE